MSNSPSLSLNNIGFERDDMPLFGGINETLQAGDILQIEGPNGVGKTTLIKVLATVLTPTEGELLWGSQPIAKNSYDYRSQLLYIGHNAGIAASLTPRENLNWWLKIQGIKCADINTLFERIGLSGFVDTPCYSLSAGQQRRVALVRLLLSECKLWVLDEPFTAIDKAGCDQLTQLMARHTQAGGIVIFSSHQDISIDGLRCLNLADYHQQVLV